MLKREKLGQLDEKERDKLLDEIERHARAIIQERSLLLASSSLILKPPPA